MAININQYVDITSGVGGGATVPRRNLIARIFTDNDLLPPGTFVEFTTADAVGSFFGTSSDEYARAVFYFGWISKNITRAQKIQFARYVSADTAPRIFGQVKTQTLSTYTAITAASFGLTIGGTVNTFSALDFSAATSLADVASVLQTAIRTKVGSMWTAATVTYDATRGCFEFVGGTATAAAISVQEGVGGTPIAATLGWLPAATFTNGVYVDGAIEAAGSLAEDPADCVSASSALSNNFGSFLFMPTLALDDIVNVATWNKTQNVKYMYSVAVSSANASAWSAALLSIGGVGLTLSNVAGEYPEQVPTMIEAATNYEAPNSVQNYMYQEFVLTPSVTTDAIAASMDALRVNYYGRTQDAGQFIDFYQRGFLMGLATDPVDMNTYANEQWLKDAAAAAIMTLLLSLARVSANAQGRSQILTTLQAVINDALNNGTISVNKILTNAQKLYITEITADSKAWYQVQSIGYWVDCAIEQYGSNPVQYKAVYTLVYSKDDVIRKVEGTHVLI